MKELARHLVGRLFEDHYRDLHTTLTRRVGCPQAAADVAQETYLRLLRRTHTDEIQNPKALLFHVAGQLAINERERRTWHEAKHENDEILANHASPEGDPERLLRFAETQTVIRAAIDAMPPRRREAFVLHRFSHYSYPQIADLLGISVVMVEKHVSAGMKECRRRLHGSGLIEL